jgi:hypothetical protein
MQAKKEPGVAGSGIEPLIPAYETSEATTPSHPQHRALDSLRPTVVDLKEPSHRFVPGPAKQRRVTQRQRRLGPGERGKQKSDGVGYPGANPALDGQPRGAIAAGFCFRLLILRETNCYGDNTRFIWGRARLLSRKTSFINDGPESTVRRCLGHREGGKGICYRFSPTHHPTGARFT